MRVAEERAIYMVSGESGRRAALPNLLELASLIEAGLERGVAEQLRRHLQLSEAQWAHCLGVSTKTLQRQAKTGEERLSAAQSDRLYRLARLVALAEEVFENDDRARRWLHAAQRGLGDRAPLDLVQTEAGAREVEDLLGRIEYGVLN